MVERFWLQGIIQKQPCSLSHGQDIWRPTSFFWSDRVRNITEILLKFVTKKNNRALREPIFKLKALYFAQRRDRLKSSSQARHLSNMGPHHMGTDHLKNDRNNGSNTCSFSLFLGIVVLNVTLNVGRIEYHIWNNPCYVLQCKTWKQPHSQFDWTKT